MASSTSSTPSPVLPEARGISSGPTQPIDVLILHFVDHRRVHVDLVQYGNDLQVVLDSQVKVRYGLRLIRPAWRRLRAEPLRRRRGTRYLIGKVHVARSVDQVEHVFFAVVGQYIWTHGS